MGKLADVPKTAHFAVLEESSTSVHHEGDERSRTNPGHGYPAYTETIHSIDYKSFKDQDELKVWLKRWGNNSSGRKYIVLKVEPVVVEFEAVVRLG